MNKPEKSLFLDQQDRDPRSLETQHCDVLVITVIDDLEEKYLHDHLRHANAESVRATPAETNDRLHRWRIPSAMVPGAKIEILTKCLGNAGNGHAGIEILHLLYRNYRPMLVVFCGIGGAINVAEAQLGNVVVGSFYQWRGYDKITQGDTAIEMRKKLIHDHIPNEPFVNHLKAFANELANGGGHLAEGLLREYGNKTLRDALIAWDAVSSNGGRDEDLAEFEPMSYSDTLTPKVKFGGIMSWDYVLNSRILREEIRLEDKRYTAVDMESGGITKAIKKACDYSGNRVEFLAIRGISDLCSNKHDDLFRDIAADHAAAFLIGFLRHRFSPETLLR